MSEYLVYPFNVVTAAVKEHRLVRVSFLQPQVNQILLQSGHLISVFSTSCM